MEQLIKFSDVESRIVELRGIKVILDRDVATLYGVRTSAVNQAVKNNPGKFPQGYLLDVSQEEYDILRSKNLTAKWSSMTITLPKAFTEKGLYMRPVLNLISLPPLKYAIA